jgi:hypothetical protein
MYACISFMDEVISGWADGNKEKEECAAFHGTMTHEICMTECQ